MSRSSSRSSSSLKSETTTGVSRSASAPIAVASSPTTAAAAPTTMTARAARAQRRAMGLKSLNRSNIVDTSAIAREMKLHKKQEESTPQVQAQEESQSDEEFVPSLEVGWDDQEWQRWVLTTVSCFIALTVLASALF